MRKIKVLTVFGTRPECIKMAPLIKKLECTQEFDSLVCVTAQHRQMLDQVLDIFDIGVDFDLNIMKERQTLVDITTRALEGLFEVYQKVRPDIVLVHGDTTTTFVASLAAFYSKIKVGHIEAGLRTFDRYFPFPEEINRKLTGCLANIHFAPTRKNSENLIRESVDDSSIYITGNTVIDALNLTVSDEYKFENEDLKKVDFKNKKVLCVTAHRRENIGKPLENICNAIKRIAMQKNDVEVVYPVHLNPAIKDTVYKYLEKLPNVYLIDPINVRDMHNLMARSYLVLTDSGGIQEEAPSLGKPVLVLRNETERPEAVNAGTVNIAGTNEDEIYCLTESLLESYKEYDKMAKAVNPYGDGKASERIVSALLYEFGFSKENVESFIVQ